MERLLQTVLKDFFNYIKIKEDLLFEIDDLILEIQTEKDNRCLARRWDSERKNPNLRCCREGSYNGLCKTHYLMKTLPNKLITEYPPEIDLLRIYRQHNPNVDNEIEVFKTNKIRLFKLRDIKDNKIKIKEDMNQSSINFKHVINNLVSIVLEKKYPLDKDLIYNGIENEYKLEKINQSKKEYIKDLIEENFTAIEIEFNKLKKKEQKIEKKIAITNIKVKLPKKNNDETKSSLTSPSIVTTTLTSENDEDDNEEDDIEQSVSMKEMMSEYTTLINELNLKIPNDFWKNKYIKSVRIVDRNNLSDIICYEITNNDKILLINRQGSIIGEKRLWIDINIPTDFKNNEENVLHPETCLPLNEYKIYSCSSMFHNLTPRIYREYKWDDLFNNLQFTNEIFDQLDE